MSPERTVTVNGHLSEDARHAYAAARRRNCLSDYLAVVELIPGLCDKLEAAEGRIAELEAVGKATRLLLRTQQIEEFCEGGDREADDGECCCQFCQRVRDARDALRAAKLLPDEPPADNRSLFALGDIGHDAHGTPTEHIGPNELKVAPDPLGVDDLYEEPPDDGGGQYGEET